MSDDLVKRLRGWPSSVAGGTMKAAADRIEELEAKLAKAVAYIQLQVGAMAYIGADVFAKPHETEASRQARATLAEITETKESSHD